MKAALIAFTLWLTFWAAFYAAFPPIDLQTLKGAISK